MVRVRLPIHAPHANSGRLIAWLEMSKLLDDFRRRARFFAGLAARRGSSRRGRLEGTASVFAGEASACATDLAHAREQS